VSLRGCSMGCMLLGGTSILVWFCLSSCLSCHSCLPRPSLSLLLLSPSPACILLCLPSLDLTFSNSPSHSEPLSLPLLSPGSILCLPPSHHYSMGYSSPVEFSLPSFSVSQFYLSYSLDSLDEGILLCTAFSCISGVSLHWAAPHILLSLLALGHLYGSFMPICCAQPLIPSATFFHHHSPACNSLGSPNPAAYHSPSSASHYTCPPSCPHCHSPPDRHGSR